MTHPRVWPPALVLVERFGTARWSAPAVTAAIKAEAGIRSRLKRSVAAWLHTYRIATLDEMRCLSEEVAALRHDVRTLATRQAVNDG